MVLFRIGDLNQPINEKILKISETNVSQKKIGKDLLFFSSLECFMF